MRVGPKFSSARTLCHRTCTGTESRTRALTVAGFSGGAVRCKTPIIAQRNCYSARERERERTREPENQRGTGSGSGRGRRQSQRQRDKET
eukprot:2760923-Rhodomonas_salina.2